MAGATARLDAGATAYLAQVRQAAERLAHRSLDPADVRGALEELEALAAIDTDVPVLSRHPGVRYVKGGVKQLGGWYLRYVAQQVTAFGAATAAFGEAIAMRADALGDATADLAARVSVLEARLDALQTGAGGQTGADGQTGAHGDSAREPGGQGR